MFLNHLGWFWMVLEQFENFMFWAVLETVTEDLRGFNRGPCSEKSKIFKLLKNDSNDEKKLKNI